jgi:hypothetical protein
MAAASFGDRAACSRPWSPIEPRIAASSKQSRLRLASTVDPRCIVAFFDRNAQRDRSAAIWDRGALAQGARPMAVVIVVFSSPNRTARLLVGGDTDDAVGFSRANGTARSSSIRLAGGGGVEMRPYGAPIAPAAFAARRPRSGHAPTGHDLGSTARAGGLEFFGEMQPIRPTPATS